MKPRNESEELVNWLLMGARSAWLDGRNKRAKQLYKQADEMAARLRKTIGRARWIPPRTNSSLR